MSKNTLSKAHAPSRLGGEEKVKKSIPQEHENFAFQMYQSARQNLATLDMIEKRIAFFDERFFGMDTAKKDSRLDAVSQGLESDLKELNAEIESRLAQIKNNLYRINSRLFGDTHDNQG